MKRKLIRSLLVLEAVACMILTLGRDLLPDVFPVLSVFPLTQIGLCLRVLSLSGQVGNIVAILLYCLLGLLPLLFLLKRTHSWQDCLPVLLCGITYLALYCMINPGSLSQWAENPLGSTMEIFILGGLFYTILISIGILYLLRSFQNADQSRLKRYLQVLLCCLSALLVYLAFGNRLSRLLDQWSALYSANKGNEQMLGWTQAFLVLQFFVEALPYCLDLWIVDTLSILFSTPRHSDASIRTADQLARQCRISLTILILSNLGYQLLQLLFVRHLTQTSSTIQFPLLSLLFVLAVRLAFELLQENKQLKDDADLVI